MKLEYTGDWYITPGEDNNFLFDTPYISKQTATEALKTEYGSGYVGEDILINFSLEDVYEENANNVIEKLKEQYRNTFEDDWDIPIYLKVALNLQIANTIIDFLNLHNLNVNKLGVIKIERIENDL